MYKFHPALPVCLFATLLFSALFSPACSTSRKSVRPPSKVGSLSERQFREEVVRYGLQIEGSSYKYAGTNPRSGFDCSGFTSYVLKQFGVAISSASSAQATEGVAVSLDAVQPGDLIIFGKNKRNVQHVAMVVESGRKGIVVVHSTTSRGVIRENISTSAYWKPLILSARDVISGR